MDPTATRWRALEIDVEPPPGGDSASRGDPPPTGDRPWILFAGLAVAVIGAVVAIMLVASGPTPTVEIERVAAVDASGDVSGDPSGGAATGARPVPSGSPDLVVEVAGAVVRPGLYRLPIGSRIADALTAAGGYGPRVDVERSGELLNLAARLADGDQVRVPSRDDTAAATTTDTTTTDVGSRPAGIAPAANGAGAGPVDLNHATGPELEALPGIGPATAAKIIAAREEQPFGSVDELRARKVVGAATFEKIRALVTVR
jgi:competence protein ComEA